MEKIVLKATKRNVTGKQVKALRRAGQLPAVIYGRHVEPIAISLEAHSAGMVFSKLTSSTLVTVDVEGEEFVALVREKQRALARRQPAADAAPAARRTPEEERHRKEALEARRTQAVEMAAETFDALMAERGDGGKIWASVLKEAIKRRTGARGLRAILEELMLDVMYELPGKHNVRECVVTDEVVHHKKDPILVYENDAATDRAR